MKLLFFVQMLKGDDTIRGFIPGWSRALAQNVEELIIISQETHEFDIGKNIRVFSLGKERGYSKWKQFFRLQTFLSKELFSREPVAILTHMTPIYTLIVAPLAGLAGVPVFTWYTHGHVPSALKVADQLSKKCFTASHESFRLFSPRRRVIGHGIDREHFALKDDRFSSTDSLRFITASRLSPTKNLHILLEALESVPGNWTLDIAGEVPMDSQKEYGESLKKRAKQLGERVTWHGAIPYSQMPDFLNRGDLYLNLSATGSLDKGVLEAIASGLTVLTSNEAFHDFLGSTRARTFLNQLTAQALSDRLNQLLTVSKDVFMRDQKELAKKVSEEHDLKQLAQKIVSEIEVCL